MPGWTSFNGQFGVAAFLRLAERSMLAFAFWGRPWPDTVVWRRSHIALISTGGTIEKEYDELDGVLVNEVSNLDVMLAQLELRGVQITRMPLMNKDSLDMTAQDHTLIARTAELMSEQHDGVVVVHGTDRLALTGERIVELAPEPRVPIVLTGAMRPYQMRNTDATQNLIEAMLAVQLAAPGVYLAMHNRLLKFPGVLKDRRARGFVTRAEVEASRKSRNAMGSSTVAVSNEPPYGESHDHDPGDTPAVPERSARSDKPDPSA